MSFTIWTIGHSTHEITEFITMLKNQNIEILVDVRSLPGSNKFPQYNQENLSVSLEDEGIGYKYMKALGGLRKKQPDSHNTVWRNASFRNYADYMETDDFKKAVGELENLAQEKRVCICCAEAVWWRCHRSMIADYLKSKNWKVLHIMSEKKVEKHPYTQPAKIVKGKLIYGEG